MEAKYLAVTALDAMKRKVLAPREAFWTAPCQVVRTISEAPGWIRASDGGHVFALIRWVDGRRKR